MTCKAAFPSLLSDLKAMPRRSTSEGISLRLGDHSMLADSAVDQAPRMPYHEFYLDDFEPRPHYRPLWEHIRRMGQNALATKAQELQLAMRTEGITFAVYSETEQGIERVWPFDLIPRIIPTAEWAILESGLKQRVRALNLFLKDIYHQQRILKDAVIPAQLIYQGRHFRHEIIDIDPPHDIYTHVGGIDIVRDDDGRYLILEDNLRTPSGVSYMIANRVLQRRILPEFFTRYRVRRVEHYPALLLQALRHVSPRGKDQAETVVLTPGIYNSAYFEHTFLAKEMGGRTGRRPRFGGQEQRGLHEDDGGAAARGRDLSPRR
jgi:uncharacterized circularly permuted ATP-grasp superfamily protein